ncbi:MAG: alanine--glyoxylate aminotransferase family protein, partial [Gaiellales bacterium]
LLDWKERWIDGGRERFPYTPSVQDVHGVAAACDDLLDLGLETSIATHERAARACRAGVTGMGLELWPRSEEIAATCVTAVATPPGVDHGELLAHIRERYGVMLSGGYGELLDKLIRIGHMGLTAQSLNPVVGIAALGRGLADLGVGVQIGAGVDAALEVLAEPLEAPVASR